MIDISMTIVAYHNYEDIKAAVASIENHTDASIRKVIYIVDNSCFGDNEPKKKDFCEYLSYWEDVVYLDAGANLGFGKGHNYVLDRLDSKYHGIINPDILLTEDSLGKLIAYMNETNVGIAVPKLVDESGEMIKAYRRDLTVWDMFIRMCAPGLFKKRKAYHTMDDMDYTKAFDVPFAQGSFLVIQTDLYKQLKGFDDRFFMYMEDADLCKRVNEVSVVRYFPDTAVVHKWEKGSHKSMKLFKIHLQSMYRYFKKWGFR
jgi:GT2 family glycosyltransferase